MADPAKTPRVALITGASRGIGLAIALRLAQSGVTLALAARDLGRLDAAVESCRRVGANATRFLLDVGDPNQAQQTVDAVEEALGPIAILVNNAGTALDKPATQISNEEWEQVLRVNLSGPFFLCRSVGPRMRANGGGKIVNVASVAGLVAAPYLAGYSASKGGLIQLTRTLAVEWARYNIQVNAVAPGYVRTDMNAAALDNPDVLNSILRGTPAGRLGLTEDVAEAVHFLVGPNSDYVTGQVIAIDGGWTAQ